MESCQQRKELGGGEKEGLYLPKKWKGKPDFRHILEFYWSGIEVCVLVQCWIKMRSLKEA